MLYIYKLNIIFLILFKNIYFHYLVDITIFTLNITLNINNAELKM